MTLRHHCVHAKMMKLDTPKTILLSIFTVAFVILTDARELSAWQPLQRRLRRQNEPINWQCEHTVDGCWIAITCTSNLLLNHDSLICHLDGRNFECSGEKHQSSPGSLSLRFEANLATVNDANAHRLAISVRGTRGRQQFTLPWNFRFIVDPYYCPRTATEPTTVELTTVSPEIATMVPVTTAQTTLTPEVTQQPTTQPITQPTTQRPTARPTTQRPFTQPSTQPTIQRPTVQSPPSPPALPPVTNCISARNSAGALVISCSSDQTIESISYEVNGNPIGTVNGGIVSISDETFNNGPNSIELSINYASGQSYILVLSYEVRRPLVSAPASLRPCILNCSGSYSFTDGMTASCTVDSDPTGEGITSIVYNANNRGFRLANGIPTFGIGTEYFHNGLNQVEIVVSHVVCGRASLNLQFHLREPTGVCRISCSYQVVDDSLAFDCQIDNSGSFHSVSYTINRPPPFSVAVTAGVSRVEFEIPLSRFTPGRRNILTLNFETNCFNQLQQAQTSLPITLPPASSFQVEVISCDPPNTDTIDPTFPLHLEFWADTEADQVVVEATSATQPVMLMQWSVNGSPNDYRVTSALRLEKRVFREGRNTLAMAVFGVRASQIQTTCLLNIRM